MRLINATILLLLVLPLAVQANESEEAESHGEAEHHYKHSLGLFVGITREGSENHETFGIEYAYRVSRQWSLGAVVERADRERDSTLAVVFAHYWPWKGLFLGGGIGKKDPGGERENTFRATLGYEWELNKGWIINAQVNLDYIEDHDREEVYGLAFGRQF